MAPTDRDGDGAASSGAREEGLVDRGLVDHRYRLIRVIGAGGMGEVWEAMHEGIGRKVAVKILHRHYARDAEVVARFHREARAASLIGDPRIVNVLDMGMLESGSPFLVMELLAGETLAELLAREGKLPVGQAVRIALDVAGALGAAHDKGIVHRDLKPDNVFLLSSKGSQEPQRLKLLDFGIAKMRAASEGQDQPSLTQTGAAVGTPTYMSPEQASGVADVDGRTDVWSLGVLLYRMLAGTTPFVAEGYALLLVQILSQPPLPITRHRKDLPDALAALIHRLLSKERKERPASMEELAALLEPFAAWAGQSAAREGLDPRASRDAQRHGATPHPVGGATRSTPTAAAASLGPTPPRAPASPVASSPLASAPRARGLAERAATPVPDGAATVRTPVSSARVRTPAFRFSTGEQRVFVPDEHADVSMDELLGGVPPGASIKGMYLTHILSKHADRAQVLESAGVVAGRWVAFGDASFADWAKLVHASAQLRFPRVPLARAMREVARGAYDVFVDSLAGRVIFGSLGGEPDRILAAFPRFEVNIKPLHIEGSRNEGAHRLTMNGFGPKVVELLLLGIVEGALASTRAKPTFRLEVASATCTHIDIRSP